jgi:hypothetical protein
MPWHIIPPFRKVKQDRPSPTYENSTSGISDLCKYKRKKNIYIFKYMPYFFKYMPYFLKILPYFFQIYAILFLNICHTFLNICHTFPHRNESSKTKLAEYCWVITQVVGRSCSGWSGSSVLEFGFQLDSNVYAFRTTDQMYTQFQLVQNSSCGQSCGTQQPRQLGNVCTCLKPSCHCEWSH